MEYFITYIIGDKIYDGHGRYETYVLRSSVDNNEFLRLKELGAKKFDIDFKNLWNKHDECGIDSHLEELLRVFDVDYLWGMDSAFAATAYSKTMMQLIIALVKDANPNVDVAILNDPSSAIDLHEGYGLF